MRTHHKLTRLLRLVFTVSVFLIPGSAFAQFQGSEYCQICHAEEFSDWSASGHPYMLMSGEDAKNRSIPLPAGSTWSDISWVVGGFGRRVLYLDDNGYIITTTDDGAGNNQFNLLTGNWSDFHPGEANKPYDCGACHTTNFVESGQGDLPGMQGTFDAGGVQCEQCHGNNGGEGHMTGPDRIDDSSAACGACHHKAAAPGETNAIAAANGFIVNGAQYNELMASPHDEAKCTTCHDPHKRSEYSIKEGANCADVCHADIAATYQENVMADYGVTCTDCHMSQATLSGEALGPNQGDTKTHIFAINTDPAASMFTAEGDFVALDGEGEAEVTLDFACKSCHETTEMTELSRFAKNFHGVEEDEEENLLDPLHYIGINPGLSGNWWGGATRDGEGFLIEVSYRANGRIVVVASFYTYDLEGNQLWLIGAKTIDRGENVVTMNLSIPEGAMWGPDFDPADLPRPRTPWGTAEFMFDTCGTGTFIATPNAEQQALGYVEYGYDLFRDLTVTGVACPSMLNNPAILTQ